MVWLLLAVCLTVALACPTPASSLLSGFAALKQTATESVPFPIAVADEKPALVEFYAEWCGVCRSMAPLVANLHDRYGDRVNFVMMDIDDPQWRSQVRDFGVVGVPHFAFLRGKQSDHRDRLQQTLVGGHPDIIMIDAVERLLTPVSNPSNLRPTPQDLLRNVERPPFS